ncbi:hypothetical protein AX16_005502 [Volvariella volvacea WC 439]|nr:hypothetical protein AX16_005502 [Volvariella volvacea WC 439]
MNSSDHRPRFIDDLVPLILECHDYWWPRDFCRLAQVSSAWLWHVRKRLYAQPVVNSYHSATLLSDALSHNPHLSSLIQGLRLLPVASHRHASRDLGGVRFLLGLGGLRSITLGGDLSEGAERFLQLVADPQHVEQLHVTGSLLMGSVGSMPSLEWSDTMAMFFPNLKQLRLSHIELDIVPPSIPYQLHLTDLTLDQVSIVGGFLSHLVHDSKKLGQLRVSTDSSADMDEQIGLLFDTCAVDTLAYEVCAGNPAPSPEIFSSDSATTLSELRRVCLKVDAIDWEALQRICERCRNLEELEISCHRMIAVPLLQWEALIGEARSLRRFGVPRKTEGLEGLRTVCRQRNIDLFSC